MSRPGRAGSPRASRSFRILRAVAAALFGIAWVLVLAGCTSGPPTAPAASSTSSADPPSQAPATGSAVEQPSPLLRLDAVNPAVVGPNQKATVTGSVVAPADAGLVNPVVRAVKSRQPLSTRSDVAAWAGGSGAPAGTEIARTALPVSLGPGQPAPFTLELPESALQLRRSFGAVAVAVQVLGANGSVLGTVRTFVGWQQSVDYVPISLAWVVPLTLDPDPALSSSAAASRITAWQAAVGPGSRLDRVLRGSANAKVAWAVDPAVVGRDTRTPEQVAADPVTPVIDPFLAALRQGAARHTVLALPYADPDLAAVDDGPLLTELAGRSSSLGTALGTTVRTGVAWPADGGLPPGREAALRSTFGRPLTAILASTELTETGRTLTPVGPAVGRLATPVLRWDDQLSALAGRTTAASSAALVTQEFVAQVAALLGERPGVDRTFVVTPPRGLDPSPDTLSRLLATSESLPWVKTIDVTEALTEAARPGQPSADELSVPQPAQRAVLTAPMLASLTAEKTVITTMSHTLVDSRGFSVQWKDTVDALTSVRWRANPTGHAELLGQVRSATRSVSQGLSITEQTTNFLADEGTLQVTIVNDLDGAVEGIQLHLAPTNARVRVVQPADPVRIEGHSKATVQVRVAAVAAGLVPVNAWLTTSDGVAIGHGATLTVRSAPPGVWLYVVAGSVVGVILLVGVVRWLRRPKATPPELQQLDLVNPVRERPLEDPVRTRPRSPKEPGGPG